MNTKTDKMAQADTKPFRGDKYGVYWHAGGWYCAPYAADGISHYQQDGTQTLEEANAEAATNERS